MEASEQERSGGVTLAVREEQVVWGSRILRRSGSWLLGSWGPRKTARYGAKTGQSGLRELGQRAAPVIKTPPASAGDTRIQSLIQEDCRCRDQPSPRATTIEPVLHIREATA